MAVPMTAMTMKQRVLTRRAAFSAPKTCSRRAMVVWWVG